MMVDRSRDVATPAELGHDCPPDPLDSEPPDVPKDRRHELETVDSHNGPPIERCIHCQQVGYPGVIDPFAVCPDRREDGPETDVNTETETVSMS